MGIEVVEGTPIIGNFYYPWLVTPYGRLRMHSYTEGMSPEQALQKSIDVLKQREEKGRTYSFLKSEKMATKEGLVMVVGYFGLNRHPDDPVQKLSFYFQGKKGTTFCLCGEPTKGSPLKPEEVTRLVIDTLKEE